MTTDSEAIKSNRTEVVVWDWLLDRLQKLPIYHFSYKAQPDIRHVGPLAQDFHKAFPWVGEDAETISTIDAIGVLFMAVKELTKIVREQAP